MAVEIQERKILDDREIYKLKKGEEFLFTEFRLPEGRSKRHFKKEKIKTDPDFKEVRGEVLATARRMEKGPILTQPRSWDEEVQGHYKNIRVVVARHPVTKMTLRGFAFIGTPK